MASVLFIFTQVILPVLLMAGAGALVQRRFELDLRTLTRLNIWLLLPCFLFLQVFESTLGWGDVGRIVWVIFLPTLIVGGLAWAVMKWRKTPREVMATILIAGLIFNAGNFGIPVASLQHGEPGLQIQAIVVLISNVSIWCIGYAVLASGRGGDWKSLLGFFRLPMIYVVILAVLLRWLNVESLPQAIDYPVRSLSAAVVPMALITLGAQLADRIRWPNWRIVGPVLLLQLVAMPAVTAVVVWCFGQWPWPGAQLILAVAAPTAVNTLLLTLELEGDGEAAADCVAWTTITSAFTASVVLVLLNTFGGGPPG